MVKPHSPQKGGGPSDDKSTLMTDDQFEDFWALLYSRRRRMLVEASSHEGPPGADPTREDASIRGRSNKPTQQRCGTCRGCTASDCGNCKNCRDKPRFGGPGIKKKACLRRVCHKARNSRDDDEDDDDDEPQLSPTGAGMNFSLPAHSAGASEPASEVTSPRLRPSSPTDSAPADLSGAEAYQTPSYGCETRMPLEVLQTDGSNAFGQLDMLSRMASSIGAA